MQSASQPGCAARPDRDDRRVVLETDAVVEHHAALLGFNADELLRMDVSVEFLRHGLQLEDMTVGLPKRLGDGHRLVNEVRVGRDQVDVRRDHQHLAKRQQRLQRGHPPAADHNPRRRPHVSAPARDPAAQQPTMPRTLSGAPHGCIRVSIRTSTVELCTAAEPSAPAWRTPGGREHHDSSLRHVAETTESGHESGHGFDGAGSRLCRRVAGFAINRKLADQRRAWFGHYDLNDFRFLGVRKRKLAEERRKAAVPAR